MDFEGAADSPMTAFISFPQVLGHEVVATVEEAGPEAGRRDRAAGRAQPLAVVRGAGPRPRVPGVRGRRLQPVLALPRRRPRPGHPHRELGRRARRLRRAPARPPAHARPGARRRAGRGGGAGRPVLGGAARRDPQPPARRRPGRRLRRRRARHVCDGDPAGAAPRRRGGDGGALAGAGARWRPGSAPSWSTTTRRKRSSRRWPGWSGGVLRRPWEGPPVAWPGGVDVVYDTVGAPDTLEVGLRVLAGARDDRAARPVVDGPLRVDALVLQGGPARRLERLRRGGGRRRPPARHGALPRPRPCGAHRPDRAAHPPFPLEDWRDAFTTLIDQGTTGAIKCAFDVR